MGEASPERKSPRREKPRRPKGPDSPRSTRREFLTKLGIGAGAFGAGVVTGSAWETVSLPELTSDEPYNLQIPKFEYKLRNDELINIPEGRSQMAWLISLWFAERTNEFLKEPLANAEQIYRSIEWITDSKDERIKGNENSLAWVTHDEETGKRILVNLTHEGYKKGNSRNSWGAALAPITVLRDTLTHEMVHFITKTAEDEEATTLVSDIRGIKMKSPIVSGFRIAYLDENGENKVIFDDFDEATTEIISKHLQLTSGIGPGLPEYSEEAIPRIEQTIRNLRAFLDLFDISILSELAIWHAYSDPARLAQEFGRFNNGSALEKRRQGFQLLESVFSGTLTDYYKNPPQNP